MMKDFEKSAINKTDKQNARRDEETISFLKDLHKIVRTEELQNVQSHVQSWLDQHEEKALSLYKTKPIVAMALSCAYFITDRQDDGHQMFQFCCDHDFVIQNFDVVSITSDITYNRKEQSKMKACFAQKIVCSESVPMEKRIHFVEKLLLQGRCPQAAKVIKDLTKYTSYTSQGMEIIKQASLKYYEQDTVAEAWLQFFPHKKWATECEKICAENPENALMHRMLASIYLDNKEPQKAVNHLGKHLKTVQKSTHAMRLLAVAAAYSGMERVFEQTKNYLHDDSQKIYFTACFAYMNGDTQKTREAVTPLINESVSGRYKNRLIGLYLAASHNNDPLYDVLEQHYSKDDMAAIYKIRQAWRESIGHGLPSNETGFYSSGVNLFTQGGHAANKQSRDAAGLQGTPIRVSVKDGAPVPQKLPYRGR